MSVGGLVGKQDILKEGNTLGFDETHADCMITKCCVRLLHACEYVESYMTQM